MTVYLRPARDTDAGKLGQMISDAVASKPWKPTLHTGAEDIAHAGRMIDLGWVTVACDEDTRQVLGFLAQEGDFIHALFIHPQTQGQGVGEMLLDHAKSGAKKLELWTFEANKGAQRFYERAGFVETERGDGSGNEEGLPDIRYRWQPAPLTLSPQDRSDTPAPAATAPKPPAMHAPHDPRGPGWTAPAAGKDEKAKP